MTNRKAVLLLVFLNAALLGLVLYQQVRPVPPDPYYAGMPNRSLAAAATVAASAAANSPIVIAANAASPAVVSVGGTVVKSVLSPQMDEFYGPFFAQPSQRRMEVPFVGSGALIDRNGYFVTNVHVVEQVTNPFITLSDGRRVSAKLIDKDNRVDVALLKADLTNSPFAPMGDSDALVPGEWVIAIGNPFGDAIPDLRPTVTVGVVSALHRNYKAEDIRRERIYLDMIQTDAAINPGNSGGPLVNVRGEIVGINAFIVSRSGGSVGIGFAIPINRVRAVVDEIRKHGRIRNYMLDFDVLDVTPRVATMLGVSERTKGAVARVIYEEKGPAARAGLQVGDIITKADSLAIDSRADLLSYFLSLQVGSTINFEILREGKRRTLRYTIEEFRQ